MSRKNTPINIQIDGWEIFRVGNRYYTAKESKLVNGERIYTSSSHLASFAQGTIEALKIEAEAGRLKGHKTKWQAIEETQEVF